MGDAQSSRVSIPVVSVVMVIHDHLRQAEMTSLLLRLLDAAGPWENPWGKSLKSMEMMVGFFPHNFKD
jgi:hypothetical protein